MRCKRTHPANPGISLVELAITLAVLATLACIALPGLQRLGQRERLVGAQFSLVGGLELARSRALHSGRQVMLCPSVDGLLCDLGAAWHRGWLVGYAEKPGGRDTYRLLEAPLHVQPPLSGVRILANRMGQAVIFQPDGSAAGSNLSFLLCPVSTKNQPLRVVLALSGRSRIEAANARQAQECEGDTSASTYQYSGFSPLAGTKVGEPTLPA